MVFFPIFRYSHNCNLFKIEDKITKQFKKHHPDKAGFLITESTYEAYECPICNKKYSIGNPILTKEYFVPYSKLTSFK